MTPGDHISESGRKSGWVGQGEEKEKNSKIKIKLPREQWKQIFVITSQREGKKNDQG